jgi:propanol-preferring alcohol dehydrogenase
MRAWRVVTPGPLSSGPLELVAAAVPEPGPGEIRVRVKVCGVCRTDLHVAEGDLPVHRPGVVPGHEVVGIVEALGAGAERFAPGDRVGIAWLRHTCGECDYCRAGAENLCVAPRFTGWDDDGGYAEFAIAPVDYSYRLPQGFDDEHAAPLLCAGIIGYRALTRSRLPPGGSLGIFGFGGSAHIACQIARAQGATVHVITRSARGQRLALELGAATASDGSAAPETLDAAILFAPAGALVPAALERLDRGATLAIAGVHLSEIPPLDYRRHLFDERAVVSVTANTRRDGDELLEWAARLPVRVTTTPFPLERAGEALRALKTGEISGQAVLLVR